jgi:hypothetical protein
MEHDRRACHRIVHSLHFVAKRSEPFPPTGAGAKSKSAAVNASKSAAISAMLRVIGLAKHRLRSNDAAIEWEINEIQILFNSLVGGEKRGRAAHKLSVNMSAQLLGSLELPVESGVDRTLPKLVAHA